MGPQLKFLNNLILCVSVALVFTTGCSESWPHVADGGEDCPAPLRLLIDQPVSPGPVDDPALGALHHVTAPEVGDDGPQEGGVGLSGLGNHIVGNPVVVAAGVGRKKEWDWVIHIDVNS